MTEEQSREISQRLNSGGKQTVAPQRSAESWSEHINKELAEVEERTTQKPER